MGKRHSKKSEKRIRHAGPGTIGILGRKRIKKLKKSETINEREVFHKK